MSAPKLLDGYAAGVFELPEDAFIGSLVLYSIKGELKDESDLRRRDRLKVSRTALVKLFDDLGLDSKMIPGVSGVENAFRAACSRYAKTQVPLSANTHIELLVRKVIEDGDILIRDIIAEIRTTDNKTLSYDRKARMTLVRSTGSLTWEYFYQAGDDPTSTAVGRLSVDIEAEYNDLRENLSSTQIRGLVDRYLKKINAVQVQGNLYFSRQVRKQETSALGQAVRWMGDGCSFLQIPLVDTQEQRDMVTEAYQTSVEHECRDLLTDVETLKERPKLGQKAYEKLFSRWHDLSVRSKEYAETIATSSARADVALELAMARIVELENNL